MKAEIGALLDADIFAALAEELGTVTPKSRASREWPDGLTDREVEVLRLLAGDLNRREIAQRLFLTENTVRQIGRAHV